MARVGTASESCGLDTAGRVEAVTDEELLRMWTSGAGRHYEIPLLDTLRTIARVAAAEEREAWADLLKEKKVDKSICLDFDGVVHSYVRPWTSAEDIRDAPVPGAFDFIRSALAMGYRVVIQSVRANTLAGQKAIQFWLRDQGLECWYLLRVTAEKPKALVYVDDRGYRFTGEWPTVEELVMLRPWNRPDERRQMKIIPERPTEPCAPPVVEDGNADTE